MSIGGRAPSRRGGNTGGSGSGERVGCSGIDFLTAIALGYETVIRIGSLLATAIITTGIIHLPADLRSYCSGRLVAGSLKSTDGLGVR